MQALKRANGIVWQLSSNLITIAIALLNRLNNEFSHLESIPDRGFKPVEILEITKVANFVLDKIYAADHDQYNALLKSIGEAARTQ